MLVLLGRSCLCLSRSSLLCLLVGKYGVDTGWRPLRPSYRGFFDLLSCRGIHVDSQAGIRVNLLLDVLVLLESQLVLNIGQIGLVNLTVVVGVISQIDRGSTAMSLVTSFKYLVSGTEASPSASA